MCLYVFPCDQIHIAKCTRTFTRGPAITVYATRVPVEQFKGNTKREETVYFEERKASKINGSRFSNQLDWRPSDFDVCRLVNCRGIQLRKRFADILAVKAANIRIPCLVRASRPLFHHSRTSIRYYCPVNKLDLLRFSFFASLIQ